MSDERCTVYDKCDAPLCPDDLTDDLYYPGEGICTVYNTDYIRMQRKIEKQAKDTDKYFTLKMLQCNCVVGKNIAGIDPDCRDEEKSILQWLKKHKSKRELTEVEQQKQKEKMERMRNNKKNHRLSGKAL